MTESENDKITVESLPKLLEKDTKVKVAGIDVDGMLRGKLLSKEKFLSTVVKGFGFCSALFGWDMEDQKYCSELNIGNPENGFYDLLAYPDLDSFRRIPWEDNIPFFLISFFEPFTGKPVSACPRGLLKTIADKLNASGLRAMAGVEYEYFQFKVPSVDPSSQVERNKCSSVTKFLRDNAADSLPSVTECMYGYNLIRPVQNIDYFYDIFNTCEKFNCGIEGWHTETGPGVLEAALSFGDVQKLADKASLFKYVVKSVSIQYGISPCFMAKPRYGIPGNSGHVHISIVDKNGKNLFARETRDKDAKYEDIADLSDLGRNFLAGLLEGIPDIMPIFAPTINSYKRLVEKYWAPVTVSWGLEHRLASIRIIAPPTTKPEATRFEVRIPGADANPFYVLAAIMALGWRGIEKKIEIKQPPLVKQLSLGQESKLSVEPDPGVPLSRNLKNATDQFMSQGSVAREVLGDEFVDHFGGSRKHEIKLWDEAVTDWEVRRYMERV